MKYITFFLLIFATLTAKAGAVTDSLSYALGNQLTLLSLAGQTVELFKDKHDCEEFIRGIEENIPDNKMLNDSSYIISYALGGMQGVFFFNSIDHTPVERRPPLECIVEGLRRVEFLDLPGDTIEINRYMKQLPDSLDPITLPEADRCQFFRAYGVMKGLQPGLQEYIESYKPGRGFVANQVAYANGFADVLEQSSLTPKNSYDMGRAIARSFLIENQGISDINWPDFINGAKAALMIADELIPRERCEQIIMDYYSEKFSGAEVQEIEVED